MFSYLSCDCEYLKLCFLVSTSRFWKGSHDTEGNMRQLQYETKRATMLDDLSNHHLNDHFIEILDTPR